MLRSSPRCLSLFRSQRTPSPSPSLQQLRWKKKIAKALPQKPKKIENPLAIQREEVRSAARRKLLKEYESGSYPSVEHDKHVMSLADVRASYDNIMAGMKIKNTKITIRGRVKTIRDASSKLVFYDIVQDGVKLQVIYDWKNIGGELKEFHTCFLNTRVGDIISFTGYPGRSPRGELSIFAESHRVMLAPCQHVPPTEILDVEKRFNYRHVDLMIRPEATEILRLRSDIIQFLRAKFLEKNFIEVQTPIIADNAGGAIAKPFVTEATVYRNKKLALRIAPELWLKRLVIGGLERVFEIGAQFRNEGIDATHNPEFTTCEFYQAYANLEDLITFTETLLCSLDSHIRYLKNTKYTLLPQLETKFAAPFRRIDFIPALEEAIGMSLPDLADPKWANAEVLSLFQTLRLAPPSSPTLPRLLDKLSSTYLEPSSPEPTFIINHPECLSPLAKTIVRNGRRVSARVELFVGGKELVNAYEEENSPAEQRRKFKDQKKWRNEDESAFMDDKQKLAEEKLADSAYASALEWGLPPTAGWGMGIDRLCMLFTGMERIGEVLTFGGLRGVVGQGALRQSQNEEPDVKKASEEM